MIILYVIHKYLEIFETHLPERKNKFVLKGIMIGGIAALGWHTAKVINKLITAASFKVNNGSSVGDLLNFEFLPNYNVLSAQIKTPKLELSHHITTAGTEA